MGHQHNHCSEEHHQEEHHHGHHHHGHHHHGHHHHGHHHHGHHHHHHGDLKNIGVAFFLNLSFTLIEIIGGLLTNSVAVLSDALHDLGDSLALGLAWYFEKISDKKQDETYTYGYKRFTVLGAFINSIVLFIGSVAVIYFAAVRFMTPITPHGLGMIGLAILGVIVNGAAVLQLKNSDSINTRVVMLHLLEDVLGWVAVLVGSLLIYFFEWYIIDPILSIVIAIYILINVFKSLRYSLNILLQAVPSQIDVRKVKAIFQIEGKALEIDNLRIWSLDGNSNVLTVDIILHDLTVNLEEISNLKKDWEHQLLHFGIEHVTIAFKNEKITHKCSGEGHEH